MNPYIFRIVSVTAICLIIYTIIIFDLPYKWFLVFCAVLLGTLLNYKNLLNELDHRIDVFKYRPWNILLWIGISLIIASFILMTIIQRLTLIIYQFILPVITYLILLILSIAKYKLSKKMK